MVSLVFVFAVCLFKLRVLCGDVVVGNFRRAGMT